LNILLGLIKLAKDRTAVLHATMPMNPQRYILPSLLIVLFFLPGVTRAEESPYLRRAEAGIRQHRMGELIIRVNDAGGHPLKGARVAVELLRHQFLFGCNIFQWGRLKNRRDEEIYRERFADLFNYATLPFYWRDYERERGHPLYESRMKIVEWCKGHGITPKGHPLFWNNPAGVPWWLPQDREEVRRLSMERIEDCVSRFKGLIDLWDVVNEATDPFRVEDEYPGRNMLSEVLRLNGVLKTVEESLEAARLANPAATLLINDYRTGRRYQELLSKLSRNRRPPFDAIGIQTHMHDAVLPDERVWQIAETFARFGVPLHFTETTIVSGRRVNRTGRWGPSVPDLEAKQAQDAARFYTLLFGHPAVEAITWWDFTDRNAWLGAPAGFLRNDLTPKPIYFALRELIKKEWWTSAYLETDSAGTVRIRGFYGWYHILVQKSGTAAAKFVFHDRRARETELEMRIEGRK
jgi:endo-1,4-beta-xylanase